MDDRVHDDRLEDMICDVGAECFAKAHAYESMSRDAKTPLYPRSTNFTIVDGVKIDEFEDNKWMDCKSFMKLLQLLNEMFPKRNTLPNHNYEANKILCVVGIEYKKIHACPNDCILYIKEFEFLKNCLRCGHHVTS